MQASSPFRERAIVIGGGIIGLSIARRLAAERWHVTLFEKGEPGREASSAAAGILAPQLELGAGSPLIEAAMASMRLYPEFVHELEEETGIGVDLRLGGVLSPSGDVSNGDAPRPPDGAVRLAASELRDLEPALAEDIAEAFFFPDDGSVDCRALAAASLASARARGVTVLSDSGAEEVLVSGGRVRGVRSRGASVEADLVINCAGAWAGALRVPGAEVRVRPVKGQMLLLQTDLRSRASPRLTLYSHDAYVVPRTDGRVIVGTTVEDRGFDKTVEVWAVTRLLAGAQKLCPGLSDARFLEAWAGLRPRGGEDGPTVGALGPAGYFVAVGHYRNGILLAPWTARRLLEEIARAPGR